MRQRGKKAENFAKKLLVRKMAVGGMETLISILVPMYNCENKIRRCIDSLKIQQPPVYEILILDDGSTDKGYEIVQEYEKNHSFIHACRQPNSGVAAARQRLIELAQGKYIMFCDADDYFEPDAVQFIYNLLTGKCSGNTKDKEVDAILYGYNLVREHIKRSVYGRQLKEGIHSKSEFPRFHANGFSDLYWSFSCNKCYKTELCRLPELIKYERSMEDVMFNIDFLSRCRNIYVARKPLYNYVQIGESLTRSKRTDNKNSLTTAYQVYMTLQSKAMNAYPEQKKCVIKYTYIMLRKLAARASRINECELQEMLQEECRKLKRGMGVKACLFESAYVLGELKSNLKAILRRFC